MVQERLKTTGLQDKACAVCSKLLRTPVPTDIFPPSKLLVSAEEEATSIPAAGTVPAPAKVEEPRKWGQENMSRTSGTSYVLFLFA